MLSLFRKRPDPARLRDAFLRRYTGRSLIVHDGFPDDWLEELLKEPGGGGHFRIDARQAPGRKPTPVEWFVHEYLLPLGLPMPVFVKVERDAVYARHLTRRGAAIHPSEIGWLLDELAERHHAVFRPVLAGFRVEHGMDVDDNSIETDYGFTLD